MNATNAAEMNPGDIVFWDWNNCKVVVLAELVLGIEANSPADVETVLVERPMRRDEHDPRITDARTGKEVRAIITYDVLSHLVHRIHYLAGQPAKDWDGKLITRWESRELNIEVTP